MKRIIDLNNNTPAVVTLTATMLNKAIIDANAVWRQGHSQR